MQHGTNKLPSEKSFGLFFSTILLMVFAWQVIFHHNFPLTVLLLAVFIGIISLTIPLSLRPFNIGWFYVGKALHKITNPLIMAIIFFGVLTPLGTLRRWIGKDMLEKKYNLDIKSYWIPRVPPGPSPDSLSDQF